VRLSLPTNHCNAHFASASSDRSACSTHTARSERPLASGRAMVDPTPDEPAPADDGIVEVWKRRRDPSGADRTPERLDVDKTTASSELEPDRKDSD
jgi:hypothetical protein